MHLHLHALWDDLWPNVIAPSAWTLAGLGLSHWRHERQQRRRHEDLKQHVTTTTGGGGE